jgi:hypothetical protein
MGLALINVEYFVQHDFKLWDSFRLLLIDFCCLALLDNQDKRILRRALQAIFSNAQLQIGISRLVFVWVTRSLGLISALCFSLLAFTNYLLHPNFIHIGILLAGAIFYFWYYNWMIDSTPPLDRRIINCFRKHKK